MGYEAVRLHVHPHIAAVVVLSAVVSAVFVITVMSVQFDFVLDGRLAYISEVCARPPKIHFDT